MNAIRKHTDDDDGDDVDVNPTEAHRTQRELLRVLHAEGEARTRRDDHPPRKLWESAVPFVIGILIGALGTYAGISGRLATLEAVQVQQTREMVETRAALNELLSYARTQTITPTRR